MPKPKSVEEEAPPPDVAETRLKKIADRFAALVRERREINQLTADLEARKKEVGEELVAMMVANRLVKVGVDGVPVTLCKGRTASKIDAKKLLEKGVSSDIIVYATIPGTQYDYVTVGKAE